MGPKMYCAPNGKSRRTCANYATSPVVQIKLGDLDMQDFNLIISIVRRGEVSSLMMVLLRWRSAFRGRVPEATRICGASTQTSPRPCYLVASNVRVVIDTVMPDLRNNASHLSSSSHVILRNIINRSETMQCCKISDMLDLTMKSPHGTRTSFRISTNLVVVFEHAHDQVDQATVRHSYIELHCGAADSSSPPLRCYQRYLVLQCSRYLQLSGHFTCNMRLIDTDALKLVEYLGQNIPVYAILSHTWGDGEISFEEFNNLNPESLEKSGYLKIQRAAAQAKKDGCKFIWIDTCCKCSQRLQVRDGVFTSNVLLRHRQEIKRRIVRSYQLYVQMVRRSGCMLRISSRPGVYG